MANNRKKQQRKQARRKKAVAKAKKQSDKIKNSLIGNQNISFASNAPIYECLVPEDLFESGIGQVIISRKLPNGNLAAGIFLLDVFCLGIKDAFGKVLSTSEYNEIIERMTHMQALKPVSAAYARKLVEGAEAYAKNLGLSVYPGYAKAKKIFGNISVKECDEDFTFGKDGKPHYANGPYDNQTKIQQVLETLTKKLGPDGFTFTFIPRDMFDDDEDFDDDFDDDDDDNFDDDDDFDGFDESEDDDENDDENSYKIIITNDIANNQIIDIEATDVTDVTEITHIDKSKEK